MKKLLIVMLMMVFLAGCGQKKGGDILATVNSYEITRAQFEEEFRESAYAKTDTPESKKEFLDTLINRKLILQYAESEGLDKEEAFLKSIERFWEQSLLKAAIEKKSEEIAHSISAVNKKRESEAMNQWVDGLRRDAKIKIDYDLLERDN